ncbi:hypothetical protein ACFX13_013742 [Malus domestica]
MKLFLFELHDTISSVAESSTMSYVFSRNGAGPPPPPAVEGPSMMDTRVRIWADPIGIGFGIRLERSREIEQI